MKNTRLIIALLMSMALTAVYGGGTHHPLKKSEQHKNIAKQAEEKAEKDGEDGEEKVEKHHKDKNLAFGEWF